MFVKETGEFHETGGAVAITILFTGILILILFIWLGTMTTHLAKL
jgi:hypothetical protein